VGEPDTRGGLFFEAVRRLEALPAFSRAIEGMPLPAEADAFLAELCCKSAGLYCAHPEARIAYVHAVTLPAALCGLLVYFETAAESGLAALYVLQAVAALHALYGERDAVGERGLFDDEVRSTAGSWDEIRYRAACSIQEHAIKMVEACLRADARAPDPIFRLAAADAALRLEGTRSASDC
jgi:hypothetical protein